jgi:hypothetical protein
VLLHPFDIFEAKFVLNDFHVAHRVDVSFHMDDFGIIESANDLEDSVNRPYMRKERVSEPSTCRRALGLDKFARRHVYQ